MAFFDDAVRAAKAQDRAQQQSYRQRRDEERARLYDGAIRMINIWTQQLGMSAATSITVSAFTASGSDRDEYWGASIYVDFRSEGLDFKLTYSESSTEPVVEMVNPHIHRGHRVKTKTDIGHVIQEIMQTRAGRRSLRHLGRVER